MKREKILTVDEAIEFGDSRSAPIAELKEPAKTLEGHLNKNSMECYYGTRCPYVNGGDVSRLLVGWDYLRQRLDEMEKVMALAQAEIEKVRQENEKLKEERETLRYGLKQMLGKIFKPGVKPEPIAEPNIYEGTGDDIVNIEKPGGEDVAVVYSRGNEDARHFAIKGYDADGNSTSLLVNTTDPYEGIVPLDFDARHDTSRLEISATGPWYIEVRSLRSARAKQVPGLVTGSGDDVLLVVGKLDTAYVKGNDAARHFAVKGYGQRSHLLVNTTDPYKGRVIVPSDVLVLEVAAVGG